MLPPSELRCAHQVNPLGVEDAQPRLSWQLAGTERGLKQGAFEVFAASSLQGLEAGEADLWDSGMLRSDEQSVRYQGREVGAGERVWWRVRVWNADLQQVESSPPAWFEMGLNPDDWDCGWIGSPPNWPGRAVKFRVGFRLDAEIVRARVYMAGLGWSELCINEERANDRVLDPPQSDYSKRVYYTSDIVEPFLRAGENVIGVRVGQGWFGSARLKLKLVVEYADGNRFTLGTNTANGPHWQVSPDALVEHSVFSGEVYDARLEQPGWARVGAPGVGWTTAMAMEGPGGALHAANLEPIRVVEDIPPVSVRELSDGVWVVDFGVNFAGWARIRVQGEAGSRVTLRFAESLYEDGSVNQENLRNAQARDIYILKGEGVETWEPAFTYHGFRYVQVEGWPGVLTAENISGRRVRSDLPLNGSFACSHPLLNSIHEMVVRTEFSNLHSIPTDCPQRDERMGWLNDMAARSEELVFNFGAHNLLAKWLDDIQDTQDELGRITDTAPFHWGSRPADPVSVCYLLIPWLLYIHDGDEAILQKHFGGMRKWVDYLADRTEDGILQYSYYGDWSAPVGHPVSGAQGDSPISRDTPGDLVSTAFLAYSARLLAQIAQVLKKKRETNQYLRLYEETSQAFHDRFWDDTRLGYGECNQSANALALYMGLVPEDLFQETSQSLIEAVERSDRHLATGNICTKYLMDALSQIGRTDLALAIALQTDYPSWGYMLANGATTLWERWEKAVGGGMNSHNHPMMGSVGAWFYRTLAGIRVHPSGAGFRRFSLVPEMPEGLDWVECTLKSRMGEIQIGWMRAGQALEVTVTVPPGSTADIGIPVSNWGELREGERLIWREEQPAGEVEGIQALERMAARVRVQVEAGAYRFTTLV